MKMTTLEFLTEQGLYTEIGGAITLQGIGLITPWTSVRATYLADIVWARAQDQVVELVDDPRPMLLELAQEARTDWLSCGEYEQRQAQLAWRALESDAAQEEPPARGLTDTQMMTLVRGLVKRTPKINISQDLKEQIDKLETLFWLWFDLYQLVISQHAPAEPDNEPSGQLIHGVEY